MRAIVVGAGLAGLSAADALRRKGAEVVILEARDRVGGRVHSRELDNGAVVELGAEFILPGCDAVRGLAERLGLGLWDKGMRYGRREPRGGIGTTSEALGAAMAVIDRELTALRGARVGSPSARAFLDSLAIEPGAREAILARVEISSASSADDVPASDLAGLAHIDDEPAPSVAGGNQRLAIGLADGLGDSLSLGDPAAQIRWDPGEVQVATASGREWLADACVVSVPASVFDRMRFDPSLPAAKLEALAAVRYGQAAKLFVPLSEPAPPGAVMNVAKRYWTWTSTGSDEEAQPVVNAFAGSAAALDHLGVADGPDRWLESLAALRPELSLEPDDALLSTWSDDEWVRGAYSISPEPGLAKTLAEPVGPIAFAGEHVGGAFNGLMEGAIRSGLRAATELLTRRASDFAK